jgi:MFS family permease
VNAGHVRSIWSFPAFRRVFFAKAVSAAGSYMQLVAATWYVFHLTGNATSVGVLSALALGPAMVGGPLGGALIDRFDPRRLAVVLCLLQALPVAAMAVLDRASELSLWSFARPPSPGFTAAA